MFKQYSYSMKIDRRDELMEVTSILQAFLSLNQTNNLLYAWKNIKSSSKRNRKIFSNQSFAKAKSEIEIMPQSLQLQNKIIIKSNRPRHQTIGNEQKSEHGYKFKNMTFSNCDTKRSKQNNDFQDMVLQRLSLLESKLNIYRKRVHLKNDSFCPSEGRQTKNSQIKFKLNPKYIPMKSKLETMETIVIESQQYQASDQKNSIDDCLIQTPRMGSKINYFHSNPAPQEFYLQGNIYQKNQENIDQNLIDELKHAKADQQTQKLRGPKYLTDRNPEKHCQMQKMESSTQRSKQPKRQLHPLKDFFNKKEDYLRININNRMSNRTKTRSEKF